MKVVIAIDSYKGCASSIELSTSIEKGIKKVYPNSHITICPIADGGEGTVEAMSSTNGATLHTLTCKGPLGADVKASYTVLEDNTAVIEMAAASGLPLITVEERNPSITSTFGTGELIRDAMSKGVRNFIVGIGGSATNDAGLGMLRSLGYKFLDKDNKEVIYAKDLSKILKIDTSNVLQELKECTFRIACDVTNPLFGQNGASFVYGAQKGASKEMIELLDSEHQAFATLVAKEFGKDVSSVSGAGAAGGLGFGFLAFLNSSLESGIKIILEQLKFEEKLENADLVITGEGKIDRQSAMGKVLDGIGSTCKAKNIPCIAFAGNSHDSCEDVHVKGVTSVFSILSKPMSLEEAMDKTKALELVEKKSEQVFRLISSFK